jgi:ParB-like chromosome segregation protein Spo0J
MKNNKKDTKRLRRKRLPLGDIKLRPETFQFREFEIIESHVFDLGQTLKSGRELDPMLVWDSGKDGYIVIDGHHRYKAYRRCKPSAKISVRVFSGTEEEAVLLALEDNAKARLPMTAQEKSNAAWRLVSAGYGYSKADICIATGISDGTVAKMRRTRRVLIEKGEGLPKTWWQALQAMKGYEQEAISDDRRAEIIEERARALDAEIGPALGREAEIQIEAVSLVLEKRLGSKIYFLADQWSGEEGEWSEVDDDLPF